MYGSAWFTLRAEGVPCPGLQVTHFSGAPGELEFDLRNE